MLFQKAGNDTVDVVASTLDEEPEARLTYEIWTSAKTSWLEPEGTLESHPTEPKD